MALGGLCKAMTLVSFHKEQKILCKNNTQHWSGSIYLTNWARLSSWSESWNRKRQRAKIASAYVLFS